jgi:F-type H+-transporting ATPase subunit epsilon
MATPFHIEIATPDGGVYDGQITRLIVRTIAGDVCIMAKHTNYCSALGMGEARVTMEDGTVREAACMGGMVSVMGGACRLFATTWEWKEDIDVNRAERAKERAEELLSHKSTMAKHDIQVAQAKLWRALIRLDVSK